MKSIAFIKKMFSLMLCCIMSFVVVSQTAEDYKVAAEAGDAQAQFKLGECLYLGNGVEQNIKEALTWFNRSASQNYAPAQNALGKAYADGDFGTEDLVIAKRLYTAAASQGYAEAMYNLGRMCVDGYFNYNAEAVKWFAKAAGQGYAPAMFDLGHCYEYGYGVKINRKIALDWYIKASEAGYDEAKDAVTRLGEGMTNDSEY
jgi:TPR repeat protein